MWRGPGTAALPRSQRDPEASPLSPKKMYVALGGAGGEVTRRDPRGEAKTNRLGGGGASRDTFSAGEHFHHHVPDGGKVSSDWTVEDSARVTSSRRRRRVAITQFVDHLAHRGFLCVRPVQRLLHSCLKPRPHHLQPHRVHG